MNEIGRDRKVPLVLLDPYPRTKGEIFTDKLLEELHSRFTVIERNETDVESFYQRHLPSASFIIGQPPLRADELDKATNLLALINVEGNFTQNIDYQACFSNNVHVLSISPVFAQPVAELALGLALSLA